MLKIARGREWARSAELVRRLADYLRAGRSVCRGPLSIGKTRLPIGETPLPIGKTPLPIGETPLPIGKTPLPSGKTRLPNGKTPVALFLTLAESGRGVGGAPELVRRAAPNSDALMPRCLSWSARMPSLLATTNSPLPTRTKLHL